MLQTLLACAASQQFNVVVQLQNIPATVNTTNLQTSLMSVASLNSFADSGVYTLLTAGCTRGGFCPPGVGSQVLCPPSTFQPLVNQQSSASCVPCSAGSHGPAAGLSRCVPCPSGCACSAGVSVPSTCPGGSYAAGNSSVCLPCPVGSYCPMGASAPVACPAGAYGPSAGLSTCVVCPAGSMCANGSSAPTQCAAGTFSPSGASACVQCAAGSFQGGQGASGCVACPIGQACPAGAKVGTSCAAATYGPAPGLSACVLCASGTFGNTTGRSAPCPPCPAGSYCQSPVQMAPCPANTNSAAGTASVLGCMCNGGFTCGYFRTISVSFSLVNVTVADFNNDANGVQTAFLQSVAKAAGVPTTSVSLVGVTAMSRRLLRVAVSIDSPADDGYRSHKVFREEMYMSRAGGAAIIDAGAIVR